MRTLCLILFSSLLVTPSAIAEIPIDSGVFGDLEARSIGPAVMGGRIAALDAVWEDRLTIYVGAATGGVWKSINGGTTFKPVFDEHTQSVGAIAIDPTTPKTVWVGTGEPWTRNSVSVGTGVYKSTDGGENWQHVGLADTERIVKILVHPTQSDTVYVCAPGHLWDANEQRGVFKTTDGGKSWEKILYINEDTGCSDLAMDPQKPDILYAGMWQFRRWPWFFHSGGPGSSLHKSSDGGKTWKPLTQGLPEGEWGRIAVAVAPSRPSTVYAVVETDDTALYRSDDLGESWQRAGTTSNVAARPFYFSLLIVDPEDYNRVYKPATFTSVSVDGGETWSNLGGGNHPDHHAFWIDPNDINHILIGTDGGLYESNDRGVHWNFLQSLPLSQFYKISFDMQDPYYVYGGLQDNGTWMGPSRTPSGIQNKHWDNIGFGDGFGAYVDQRDDDVVYVEWQGGRIQRVRKSTRESKDIQPRPGKDDPKFRFNWNTPIHLSPNRDDTIYIGGQFLFRSRDRGETWDKISPDLTTDDPEKQKQIESGGITPDNSTAENHCAIYAISESPLNGDVIWVGTDDGNLQLTRDGGLSWNNLIASVPGLPANTWVSSIEAGRHDESSAFVTFDGHRTGDKNVYVYKTADFGRTWTRIGESSVEGYALCIRQDLVNPDLLLLGTEFGLYASLDVGANWARFKNKLPKIGVRDLAIHPREHDLIVATHGRGVFIIDDITPLRALTRDALNEDVAMLASRPAKMLIPAGTQEFAGDDQFVGSNPPGSAQITYYLKRRHVFGDLNVEVLDQDGKLIKTLPGGKRVGINRVAWNMREKPPKVAPAASLVPQRWSFFGPQVSEGTYTARVVKGSKATEGQFALVMDPRADYSTEDRAKQDETVMRLYRMVERLTYVVDAVADLQGQCKARIAQAGAGSGAGDVLDQYEQKLEAFRRSLVATRKGGFIAGEEQLREDLTGLYGAVNGYEGRPTNSQLTFMEALEARLVDAEKRFAAISTNDLAGVNEGLQGTTIAPLKVLTRDEWSAQQER